MKVKAWQAIITDNVDGHCMVGQLCLDRAHDKIADCIKQSDKV